MQCSKCCSLENYVSPFDMSHLGAACLIESALGGVYAHVHGGGHSNGTNISVWSYVKQSNLEWFIKPSEHSGYYYIVSAVDLKHDHVLHQHGGGHDNGGNISLWERVNQGNCQVRFEDAGHGYWNIVFKHSNKAVHVHGGGTSNDTNISQWDPVDQNNLKWRFVLAPKAPHDFVDNGVPFLLESGVNGWYAHVLGAETSNGTNITVWSFVNQSNLKWHIKTAERGGHYYVITDVDHGHDRVMHQHGGNNDNGGNVTLWERLNQGNCQVRFEDAGNGYFRIVFAHSNKCVHLHGGTGHDGANITQWDPVDQTNLVWRFVQVAK